MTSSISRVYANTDRKMQPVFFSRGLNMTNIEVGSIHSGHFMVSCVHDESDDPFDTLVNIGYNNTTQNLIINKSLCNNYSLDQTKLKPPVVDSMKRPLIQNTIDATLSVLLKHMSLAYSGKLTSPKWKNFKGIKVKLKDKVRLNNIIWREWHMQFIKKQRSVVCQFDIPVFEKIHSRPEAVVLEGKYWKRRLQCLTMEYKKWRMFFRQKNLLTNQMFMMGQSTDNLFTDFMDILMPSICDSNADEQQRLFSPFDTDFFPDLLEPFPLPPNFMPYSIEISQLGLGDIIQPQLLQLQPSFEDVDMEVDGLSPLLEYKDFHSNSKYMMMGDINLSDSKDELKYFADTTTPNPQISSSSFSEGWNNYFLSMGLSSPLNLTQNRPLSDTINLPLNLCQLAQKKCQTNEFLEEELRQETQKEFKLISQFQGNMSGRGNMLVPQNFFINSGNCSKEEEEPRRASTGSSPFLFFNKLPKKQVRFVLPTQATNEGFKSSNSSSYVSGKVNTCVDGQPNKTSLSHNHLPTRKNSNSILELLLSNDSRLNDNSVDSTPPTTDYHHKSESSCDENRQFGNEGLSHLQPISIGNVMSKPSMAEDINMGENVGGYKEKDYKRNYHTTAEHQRRCNIKQGFDMLNKIVPDLNKMNGCKINKATTLIKTAECCRKMKADRERMLELARGTRLEIDHLQDLIRQLQMKLPASGIKSFGLARSTLLDKLFDEYVRERSKTHWKFWIFSLIIKPWFVAFNKIVAETSRDQLFKCLFNWLHQYCSLVNLRPEVLKTMTDISRMTSILTDPSSICREATEAAISSNEPYSLI